MFPAQTCTGLGVGMLSCAPCSWGQQMLRRETLRRRAGNSAGCGKGQNQAIQDQIKWQCPGEKDRTMVAYRANRSPKGT